MNQSNGKFFGDGEGALTEAISAKAQSGKESKESKDNLDEFKVSLGPAVPANHWKECFGKEIKGNGGA